MPHGPKTPQRAHASNARSFVRAVSSTLLPPLLLACGGGATPAQAPPAPVPVSVVPGASTLLEPPYQLSVVVPPSSSSCSLRERLDWLKPFDWSLRASPANEPYARLSIARADKDERKPTEVTVSFPTNGGDPYVEADLGPARLVGYVSSASVHVHPTRAFALDDIVLPVGNAVLRVTGVAPDVAKAELLLGADEAFTPPLPAVDVACPSLSLDTGRADALALVGVGDERRFAKLTTGHHELRKVPAGPVVATIEVKEDDRWAVLLGSRGGYRRIAAFRHDHWIVGWVDASRALPGRMPDSADGGGVTNSPITRPVDLPRPMTLPEPGWTAVSCPSDVHLYADEKGARTRVGHIVPKRTFFLGPIQPEGKRSVSFPDTSFDSKTSKLIVLESDVARCTE